MIVIQVLLIGLVVILFLISRQYDRESIEELDKKEHPLKELYPMALFLLNKFGYIFKLKEKKKVQETLLMLYVGENQDMILRMYYCKKIATCITGFLVAVVFSFLYMIGQTEGELFGGNQINRPSYGEGSKKVNLDITVDKSDKEYLETNLDIEVPERRYDKEQILQLMKSAEKYIDDNVLGENTSSNAVNKKLNLITSIPGTSISVGWDVDENIVKSDGSLQNTDVEKNGVLTELTAMISYYDTTVDYTFALNIMPKKALEDEKMIKEIKKSIYEAANSAVTEQQLVLPERVGRDKIYYAEKEDDSSHVILVLGVVLVVLLYFAFDKGLSQKMDERNIQLAIDYPELINKFTLLLGAGMTMKAAWGKITKEYEIKLEKNPYNHRYAYDEMLITWHELTLGVTEVKAFERFGRRVKLLPYLKFSSLISQNIKKGSSGLLELLEYEAMDAFEERKELAKRLGEKAGTKLLAPMMIMLVIVLFIIMIPAFMTLGG